MYVIIKTISRKSNVGQLIKYIFRNTTIAEKSDVDEIRNVRDDEVPYYVPGKRLSWLDRKHLHSALFDARLMKKFHEFTQDSDYKGFIKKFLANDEQQKHLLIKHNLFSNSLEGFSREFEVCQAHRQFHRKDENIAIHTVLSWGLVDSKQLTDEVLQTITDKYIELRGNNMLFLGTVHREASVHLHIAESATSLDFRSTRLTKENYAKLKNDLQAFQKERFPELQSLPVHGRSKSG